MRSTTKEWSARPTSTMSTGLGMRFGIVAMAMLAVLALAFPTFSSADPLGKSTSCKGFRSTAFITQGAVGADGNAWGVDSKLFSGGIPAISRVNTTNCAITNYIAGTNLSGLNAESEPIAIVAGPGGSKYLWFTDRGSTPAIGVLDTANPETVTEFSIEGKGGNAGSSPLGIAVGPDGNLWFADSGTTPAIGKIKLSAPNEIESITECSSGLNAESQPHGIVAGPDGNLWFTDSGPTRAIGKINPSTCSIEEFATGASTEPGGNNTNLGPWGIAAGSDGNVWFTDGGSTKSVCSITPSGTITCFSSGLVASSRPTGLTAAPDGKLWFTDESGVNEKQKIKFEGTWANGNEFELCNEAKTTCSKKAYSTTATTLRNNIKAALEVIYGTGTFTVSGSPPTITVTFSEEGKLVATNVAQTSCEVKTGSGTCKGETETQGVPNAVASITTSGTITRYTLDGLNGVKGIVYTGGSVWFFAGRSSSASIVEFGIETPETLTVSKTGSGSGTVTSSPAGINCGFECSAEYEWGKEVTLSQEAAEGSEFAGWGGACSGTGECKVTMTQAREVTAQFDEKTGPTNKRTITVTKSPDPSTGKGIGTVSSKPKGIKCAQACTKAVGRFYKEQAIVLTAAPYGETSKFKEWTGACSGKELTCTIAAGKADKEVGAVFEGTSKAILSPTALTLSKGGSEGNFGYGTVKASGLTCESECDETTALYQGKITSPKPIAAKTVELKALAAFGSKFTGWSGGGCSGTEPSCKVTMDEAKTVTAEFAALSGKALTVEKAYSGGLGTVSSKIKGIKCGNTCTQAVASMPEGAAILLTAKAAVTEPPSTFVKWEGGDCAGKTEVTCTVTMDKAETVKAVFSGPVKAIANSQKLTLNRTGTGSGTVKASGLACEGLCTSTSALYYGPVEVPKVKAGAKVILKATSAPGSKAVAWTGCASNPTPSECVVEMSAAKEVTAKFDELE